MPRPIPPQEAYTDLTFPLRGIDISRPFSQQPPQTTPIGQNVRAYEPATGRARGGARPGLSKYIAAQVFSQSLIQELGMVVGVGYTPPGT